MKKIMIMFTFFVAIAFSVFAQKIDASKVPAAVRSTFEKQYPGIKPSWEKEKNNFEAGFKQNGNIMSALFDANGKMIESEMDIKVADLPAPALTYIKEHYKNKIIKEAAKIIKADGTINYEAEVNGKDIIFSENGKFLKVVQG